MRASDRRCVMSFDRDALDLERNAGDAQLKLLASQFERGFDEVKVAEPAIMRYTTAVEPMPEYTTIENIEIKGMGDTLAEALKEWEQNLANAPQSGKMLYWRVQPECDWTRDFRMAKTIWRAFARIAVLQK